MGFDNCNFCYNQWQCNKIPCLDRNENLCDECLKYCYMLLQEALTVSFEKYQQTLNSIFSLAMNR
jgi:hypothetical protein